MGCVPRRNGMTVLDSSSLLSDISTITTTSCLDCLDDSCEFLLETLEIKVISGAISSLSVRRVS